MVFTLAQLDLPQRSRLGHLWCSTLSGAVRLDESGMPMPDVAAAIPIPAAIALVVGMIVGVVAGLATLAQRGRFDANLRRRTARILGLVVAVPGGVLLFPFWSVSTSSNVLFALAMLSSVFYVGSGTYLTARVSLLFVLGAEPPAG